MEQRQISQKRCHWAFIFHKNMILEFSEKSMYPFLVLSVLGGAVQVMNVEAFSVVGSNRRPETYKCYD